MRAPRTLPRSLVARVRAAAAQRSQRLFLCCSHAELQAQKVHAVLRATFRRLERSQLLFVTRLRLVAPRPDRDYTKRVARLGQRLLVARLWPRWSDVEQARQGPAASLTNSAVRPSCRRASRTARSLSPPHAALRASSVQAVPHSPSTDHVPPVPQAPPPAARRRLVRLVLLVNLSRWVISPPRPARRLLGPALLASIRSLQLDPDRVRRTGQSPG